jgi:hypothetical protein
MTPAELRDAAQALVERTVAEQGLPTVIDDPGVLGRIAVLLGESPAMCPDRLSA